MANKRNNTNLSGLMLLAKKPGITSFSSLFSIKHALNTEKVGHTGTLDSFAEGLLVVLTGNLTHLVPHITGFKKTYQAMICFGKETDTFDPCGSFTKEGRSVTKEEILSILPSFTGALLQTPPLYSAVHVDGQRASDLVRDGQEIHIEPRQIFVYRNELLEYRPAGEKDGSSYAILEIECSKGTYIRALARDMAEKLGTCAHLCALRRIKVGPFSLEDAALNEDLKPFTIENGLENEKAMIALNKKIIEEKKLSINKKGIKDKNYIRSEEEETELIKIKSYFRTFTPELAQECGFEIDQLKAESESSFLNGRPLSSRMFNRLPSEKAMESEYHFPDEIAVFYSSGSFAGMIKKGQGRLNYAFVVPKKDFKIVKISWQNLLRGEFPREWKEKGTALSIGSFDGFHSGHKAIGDCLLKQKNLVPGVITFTSSVKSRSQDYQGDLLTLYQKLNLFQEYGLQFAIVIDFSDDFSKIEGAAFIKILLDKLNMKYLAEGQDFRCGYKGALTMKELKELSAEEDFQLEMVPDVIFEGERVSSSRIRKAVEEGKFLSASKMLTRPYTYDLVKCLGENNTVQGGEQWYTFKVNGVQLLPEKGNYDVVALLSQKNSSEMSAYRTSLCVDSKDEVKLLLPSDDSAGRVKGVNFI